MTALLIERHAERRNAVIRFLFRLLTPIVFLFAVMMYLADFRLAAVAFAAAGYGVHLISVELNASS